MNLVKSQDSHRGCRDLQGWCALILRPKAQAQGLANEIKKLAGNPILMPTIELLSNPIAVSQRQHWQEAILRAEYLIAVSQGAYLLSPTEIRLSIQQNKNIKIVTMGRATSHVFEEQGQPPYFTPQPGTTSEKLLAEPFFMASNIANKEVVVLAGEDGRALIVDSLRDRGANVTKIVTYRQQKIKVDRKIVNQLINQQKFVIIATSLSMLKNFFDDLDTEQIEPFLLKPLIVVSARVAHAAKEYGFKQIFDAQGADTCSLIKALQCMAKVCDTEQ